MEPLRSRSNPSGPPQCRLALGSGAGLHFFFASPRDGNGRPGRIKRDPDRSHPRCPERRGRHEGLWSSRRPASRARLQQGLPFPGPR